MHLLHKWIKSGSDSLPPTRVYFLLKDLFSQTLHKICEKHCHSIYYTLYCRSAVFKCCWTIWLPFRNTSREILHCGEGGEGVRARAVLGPFFPFCSELPLLFLVLLRICGFFFSPYSFVILLVGGGGVAEWCRGFSNKRVKWYFYHINFNYSIPCVSHWKSGNELWPLAMFISSYLWGVDKHRLPRLLRWL